MWIDLRVHRFELNCLVTWNAQCDNVLCVCERARHWRCCGLETHVFWDWRIRRHAADLSPGSRLQNIINKYSMADGIAPYWDWGWSTTNDTIINKVHYVKRKLICLLYFSVTTAPQHRSHQQVFFLVFVFWWSQHDWNQQRSMYL